MFCGARAGSCQNTATRIVDFDAGVIEVHTCIPDLDGGSSRFGGSTGDEVNTRPLPGPALATVSAAVDGLRFETNTIQVFDGAMTSVVITRATGAQSASPEAACGPSRYTKITSGYSALRAAVDGL